MKHAPNIVGGLLGLLFLVFGLNFFLKFIPMPPGPPEGSPPALFMAALYPTGYLAFVKCLEIAGGILVVIPKTRKPGTSACSCSARSSSTSWLSMSS